MSSSGAYRAFYTLLSAEEEKKEKGTFTTHK